MVTSFQLKKKKVALKPVLPTENPIEVIVTLFTVTVDHKGAV